jgi:hypothetical protein
MDRRPDKTGAPRPPSDPTRRVWRHFAKPD